MQENLAAKLFLVSGAQEAFWVYFYYSEEVWLTRGGFNLSYFMFSVHECPSVATNSINYVKDILKSLKIYHKLPTKINFYDSRYNTEFTLS